MKHLSIILTMLVSTASLAQNSLPDSLFDPQLLIPGKQNRHLKAELKYGALANGASTLKIIDFVQDDFLDQNEKKNLLSQMGTRLRYGLTRELSFGYRQPATRVFDKVRTGQGFFIRNRFYQSTQLDNDLVNLLFYGNAPYADQTLAFDASGYETWYFTSLDYVFDVLLDSLQPMAITVGIELGHDHNSYRLRSGSLYTAPGGEYLDVKLDYGLRDKTGNTIALGGLGLGLGAKTNFGLSHRSRLEVELADVGIMQWANGRKLQTDSNFRFTGARFENIFDITDSISDALSDNYTGSFLYEEEDNYLAILPFYVSLGYHIKLKGAMRSFFARADYRYLVGFYPRVRVGVEFNTGYHQGLTTSISAGGYNWLSVNTAYHFELADLWHLDLRLQNLNGLVAPDVFGGAVGYLG
ncbi:MAG: hypothetical protein U5L96_07665 [Owenweeksia sp.]|nr:hypothetical protein [Owenweeksia sp.]